MNPAFIAVVIGVCCIPPQEPEPIVIYGFAMTDAGDSTFIRLEFSGPPDRPEASLAMFGRVPVAFDSVAMTFDTSTISWIWPDRIYKRCELTKRGEYHWDGECRSESAARRILLGGGYTPDLGQDLPASQIDLDILDRAMRLLESDESWNRADERICEDDERSGRPSLFCALYLASIEVTGQYLHRRPAMNAPRDAIWERARSRVTAHTLKDFNNHPATSFSEIQAVLIEARGRLERSTR